MSKVIIVNNVREAFKLLRRINRHGYVKMVIIVAEIDHRKLGGLVHGKDEVDVVDSLVLIK